jgi:hypothetical protein
MSEGHQALDEGCRAEDEDGPSFGAVLVAAVLAPGEALLGDGAKAAVPAQTCESIPVWAWTAVSAWSEKPWSRATRLLMGRGVSAGPRGSRALAASD